MLHLLLIICERNGKSQNAQVLFFLLLLSCKIATSQVTNPNLIFKKQLTQLSPQIRWIELTKLDSLLYHAKWECHLDSFKKYITKDAFFYKSLENVSLPGVSWECDIFKIGLLNSDSIFFPSNLRIFSRSNKFLETHPLNWEVFLVATPTEWLLTGLSIYIVNNFQDSYLLSQLEITDILLFSPPKLTDILGQLQNIFEKEFGKPYVADTAKGIFKCASSKRNIRLKVSMTNEIFSKYIKIDLEPYYPIN